ncbi:MAG: phage holin family protein [Burkholderiales bacterium]
MRILVAWLVNALALFVLPYVFPWVSVDSMGAALLAALVLGLVNALIRPLAILLTLPATILTLGLFIFVINGLLFWWVGSFLEGFRVSGFWPGFFGAIVYSLISWAIGAIVLPGPRPSEPPAPGAR